MIGLLAPLVSKLLGWTVDAAGSELRKRLKRDPQSLAFKLALTKAWQRVDATHPGLVVALSGDENLLREGAGPLLARCLTPNPPDRDAVAAVWREQVSRHCNGVAAPDLEAAAADLVNWFLEGLREQPAFHDLFLGRSIYALEKLGGVTVDELVGLRQDLLRVRYPLLDDYVNWPSVRETAEKSASFVGRQTLLGKIDDFSKRASAGYLRVEAGAGLGKSALAATVAARRRCPAFFFNAQAGIRMPSDCLNHLCVELIDRFELERDHLPATAGETSSELSRLLDEAVRATPGRPVWLVVDALDEAESPPGANVALMPDTLPAGVFVLLTQRPGEYRLRTGPATWEETAPPQQRAPRAPVAAASSTAGGRWYAPLKHVDANV